MQDPVLFHALKEQQQKSRMSTCNPMSSTASKVTMINRMKLRKGVSSETKAVSSVVHQTKNSQPLMMAQHPVEMYLDALIPEHGVFRHHSCPKESRLLVPRYMNTYRLESKNGFNCALVYTVLEDVVYKHCFGVKYDPVKCAAKVLAIAGDIMRRVKQFEFDRNQEFETSVTFLWDASKDKFATYSLKSGSMFITATCFGIYQD